MITISWFCTDEDLNPLFTAAQHERWPGEAKEVSWPVLGIDDEHFIGNGGFVTNSMVLLLCSTYDLETILLLEEE